MVSSEPHSKCHWPTKAQVTFIYIKAIIFLIFYVFTFFLCFTFDYIQINKKIIYSICHFYSASVSNYTFSEHTHQNCQDVRGCQKLSSFSLTNKAVVGDK